MRSVVKFLVKKAAEELTGATFQSMGQKLGEALGERLGVRINPKKSEEKKDV